jgi:arginase
MEAAVSDTLLCLNSEWQGCESPVLGSGSAHLAAVLFEDRTFVDIGPSATGATPSRDGVFALDCIAERLAKALAILQAVRPGRILTVGGTCGVEAAPVAYLAERYGEELGVVWLDAHGDLNTPQSSPSGHFHGMVLRTLLGEGPDEMVRQLPRRLDPARLVLAGIRDLDEAEERCLESAGIMTIRGWSDSWVPALAGHLRNAGIRRLYIHIDVDVFDPRDFGDALFSVAGGPTLEQVGHAIRELSGSFDVVGVGVVEYCGRQDHSAASLARMLAEGGVWPPARSDGPAPVERG